jgi:hypothetical protein
LSLLYGVEEDRLRVQQSKSPHRKKANASSSAKLNLGRSGVLMIDFIRPNLSIPGSASTVRVYWLAIGLFTLLFVGSIVLTLSDLETSYKTYAHLGFSTMWTVFFNAAGKTLGLLAIWHNKSRTLKTYAFAGFLFDLLLALSAHAAQQEIDVLLAIAGLAVWGFAFAMDQKIYPTREKLQTF